MRARKVGWAVGGRNDAAAWAVGLFVLSVFNAALLDTPLDCAFACAFFSFVLRNLDMTFALRGGHQPGWLFPLTPPPPSNANTHTHRRECATGSAGNDHPVFTAGGSAGSDGNTSPLLSDGAAYDDAPSSVESSIVGRDTW